MDYPLIFKSFKIIYYLRVRNTHLFSGYSSILAVGHRSLQPCLYRPLLHLFLLLLLSFIVFLRLVDLEDFKGFISLVGYPYRLVQMVGSMVFHSVQCFQNVSQSTSSFSALSSTPNSSTTLYTMKTSPKYTQYHLSKAYTHHTSPYCPLFTSPLP